MRSRQTNFLQVTVIVTGVLYIITGIFLYLSPVTLVELFGVTVSDSWLELIKENELVAPLYTLLRGLGGLLLAVGLSNIMPLFEPERFRGMIYYNNVLFPGLALIVFLRFTASILFFKKNPGAENVSIFSGIAGHSLVMALALILLLIFGLSIAGLVMTRHENGKK